MKVYTLDAIIVVEDTLYIEPVFTTRRERFAQSLQQLWEDLGWTVLFYEHDDGEEI